MFVPKTDNIAKTEQKSGESMSSSFSENEVIPVAVLLQRRNSNHRWQTESWKVGGVLVGEHTSNLGPFKRIRESTEGEDYLCGRLSIRMHKDEVESYYFNLISPKPSIYVISRFDESGRPVPFLVSPSFDEANAYMEADEEVDAVPLPGELHGWIEGFVLNHYAPEKRTKRKRKNWKEDKDGGSKTG